MDNKKLIDENLIPLSKEEAIATMFFGEHLVNGAESADIAQYKWDGRMIVRYNCYQQESGKEVTEYPQLYRQGTEGYFGNNEEKERFKKNKKIAEDIIRKAIIFAAIKHDGQKRKGSDIPYIYHPMEVMQILIDNECPKPVIIAGVLHDVLEDTDTVPSEIMNQFGEDILKIVIAESEDKSKSWKERKQTTIDRLAVASKEVRLVGCADKLANLRSIALDIKVVGDKLWERFNTGKSGKEKIRWYYTGVVSSLSGLSDYKMYNELKSLLGEAFG